MFGPVGLRKTRSYTIGGNGVTEGGDTRCSGGAVEAVGDGKCSEGVKEGRGDSKGDSIGDKMGSGVGLQATVTNEHMTRSERHTSFTGNASATPLVVQPPMLPLLPNP